MAEKKYPIDGNKLYECITLKYGNMSRAGVEVGFSGHAFNNPCRRGEITEKMKILADKILGIPYKEYASDVPIPRDISVTRTVKSKGEPCLYCKDDCQFLADIMENRFNLSVAILPKRKVLEAMVTFGEDDHCSTVISDKIWINYCPNCGRKLD